MNLYISSDIVITIIAGAVASLLAALTTFIIGEISSQRKKKQAQKDTKLALNGLLSFAATDIVPTAANARTNLYIQDPVTQTFYLYASNQEQKDESLVKFLPSQGIIGLVWNKRAPVAVNYEGIAPEKIQKLFNLTSQQTSWAKNINSIVAVPIVTKQGTSERIIGVLTVESPQPMEVSKLQDSDLVSRLVETASVISPLVDDSSNPYAARAFKPQLQNS